MLTSEQLNKKIETAIKLNKKAKELKVLRQTEDYLFNDWWDGSGIFGNTWASHFFLCGPRGVGKSYFLMNMFIRQWKDTDGIRVFYWIRLTDTEQEMLLKDHAANLIDPDIKRKFFPTEEIQTAGSAVYVVKRDNETNKIVSKKLLCHVLALSTAHKLKGVGFYDKDYIKQPKAWYNICFDEINREPTAKRTFDIASAVKSTLESIIRKTKHKIRIVYIGNLTGTSDILAKWNFIPEKPGLFKLRKRRVLIENIEATESYKKMVDDSALGAAFDLSEDSNYTNEIPYDRSLIIPKKHRLVRPTMIIKFSKHKDQWFTVWDSNIIKKYNNENVSNRIPMRKYLDEVFNPMLVDNVYDMYNARAFKYKDLSTQILFQCQLELLKK